jgi:DNA-nicking Smr family endonuclease
LFRAAPDSARRQGRCTGGSLLEDGGLKRIPIEDCLDLHSFLPKEVASVVSEYLDAARGRFREVRLIHGRGIGVQREVVRSLLERRDDVELFFDAPPERGGRGATVVIFR